MWQTFKAWFYCYEWSEMVHLHTRKNWSDETYFRSLESPSRISLAFQGYGLLVSRDTLKDLCFSPTLFHTSEKSFRTLRLLFHFLCQNKICLSGHSKDSHIHTWHLEFRMALCTALCNRSSKADGWKNKRTSQSREKTAENGAEYQLKMMLFHHTL